MTSEGLGVPATHASQSRHLGPREQQPHPPSAGRLAVAWLGIGCRFLSLTQKFEDALQLILVIRAWKERRAVHHLCREKPITTLHNRLRAKRRAKRRAKSGESRRTGKDAADAPNIHRRRVSFAAEKHIWRAIPQGYHFVSVRPDWNAEGSERTKGLLVKGCAAAASSCSRFREGRKQLCVNRTELVQSPLASARHLC